MEELTNQDMKNNRKRNTEKSWRLKKIIRESSGDNIICLLPNRMDLDFYNIVCSLSRHQVNIYDSEHFGNNLDLFMAFRGEPEEDFVCGAWVLPHLQGNVALSDAILAVGSSYGRIHLLSLGCSEEIEILEAHPNASIVALAGSHTYSMTFVSSATDGKVKIWKIENGVILLGVLSMQATMIAWNDSATHLILIGKDSMLRKLPLGILFEQNAGEATILQEEDSAVLLPKRNAKLSYFQVLKDNKLVAIWTDGIVVVLDIDTCEYLAQWEVHNLSKSDTCQFGISPNGEWLAISNANGTVSCYEIATGKKLERIQNDRIRKSCRNIAFGASETSLILSTDCLLWHFVVHS
eukprot:jgi/Galph1/1032/GphlegSOOS_G5782.1